jgi:hypothetical protein
LQIAAKLKEHSRMPKKAGAKKTTFGADLIEGMKLVPGAPARQGGPGAGLAEADRCQGDSQAGEDVPGEFARAYGLSKRALHEYEQGGRQPDSAARAYFTVIAKEPA